MPFILNAWYVAAWPAEVSPGAVLGRTICGKPMAFFRDAAGAVAALEDRCCHREMPLSLGLVENGTLRCGYHGLRFDGSGACVEIPGQVNIPPRARVRRYPAVERYGWIWVWPGDAAAADPAAVPAIFQRMDHPEWTPCGGTTYVKCHYQLISDNLLDLTHEAYIHRSSLGNQAVVEHPITVKGDAAGVTVQRLIPDHEPAPFWKARLFGKLGRHVNADRWQIIRFEPPANLVLDVGVTPAGRPRVEGVEACNTNAITPETEDSTWYFWGFARKFNRDDAALSTKLMETIAKIFEEDRAACEAVHRVMRREPGRAVVDVNADQGTILARRMVAERLKAEAAANATSARAAAE
jgi:phenylpropionate dioxygenase-like ring-hydroxylating dioxygenase large terminal subunit